MICTNYQEGEKLDVAGLNVVTVLVDRSQTQLTEIGWNCWRPGLEGPPHSHDAKEQIFYVTEGEGTVVVGKERYPVKPGSMVYVPRSVVHQTIVTGAGPLSYFLFNAFLDEGKEGHASFADHIDKVKQVRLRQAQAQQAAVANADARGGSDQPGKCIQDVPEGHVLDSRTHTAILLLGRNETSRCEVTLVICPRDSKKATAAHPAKEQTLVVLSGRGVIRIGDESRAVSGGDVVFVPWNTAHTTGALDLDLSYLCFSTLVTEPACKGLTDG
jgi:mannose-6-phosphate isomerase-like protein (cupin superfamily)